MSKIFAALSLILSVSDAVLGANWLIKAKENDWDPKRIFYAIVWLLSAVMQAIMACDLLSQKEEDAEYVDADWDDLDDYED